jgi:hypothetical protein
MKSARHAMIATFTKTVSSAAAFGDHTCIKNMLFAECFIGITDGFA